MHVTPGSLSPSDIHGSLLLNGHLAKSWDLYAGSISLSTAQTIDNGREQDGCADSGAQFADDAQHGLVDSTRRGLLNERYNLGDLTVVIIPVTGSLTETLVSDIWC